MRSPSLCAWLPALLCAAAPAAAGEMLSLSDKVFGADVILEARLSLDQPIPAKGAGRKSNPKSFPSATIDAARKSATVERLIKSRSPDDKPVLPEGLYVFSASSPCWWKAHKHKGVRLLLFFRQDPSGALKQIAGVEQDSGRQSDLNPDYEALVAAVQQASAWHEERMRAVSADQLWPDERAALRSQDPFLLHLASAFLRAHDSASVVDEAWGAPGSEGRKQREKAASLPVDSVCKP